MSDTTSKLAHLLPHWVEHNDAHLETYRQWAERARDEGLDRVAGELNRAIESVEKANRALSAAIQAMPAETT